jgi:hypothetical protein
MEDTPPAMADSRDRIPADAPKVVSSTHPNRISLAQLIHLPDVAIVRLLAFAAIDAPETTITIAPFYTRSRGGFITSQPLVYAI